MGKTWGSLVTGFLLFASFSSSSNYSLNSYSVGPVGTSNSHSTTYYTQSTGGAVAGGTTSSTHYSDGNGNVPTEQIAVPQAPTVSNGGGSYITYLLVTLNDNAGTNSYPADVAFSIGVSTTNCFTSTCVQSGAVKFVQTGGTLSTTQYYQSYSSWGGSSGVDVTGLTAGTTYYVSVAAKQGTFTNTEYGPSTSGTTGSSYLTYSVSPNTLSLTGLLPTAVTTSSNVTFDIATSATYGATIYDSGEYGGLYSSSKSSMITSANANLATATSGFGLQGVSTSDTTGGPLSISSPYNVTGNNVGVEGTTTVPIFTTPGAITGGTATMNVQARPSTSNPPSTDYSETLTFIAAGSF